MKTHTSWILTALAALAIIGGIVWYAGRPGQYDTFAICIADSGAKFFGASWCPHCQAQKALFGKSAAKLPYIECSTLDQTGQTQMCIDQGIKSYPTWEFADGSRQVGELSFEQLASSTGCAPARDSE